MIPPALRYCDERYKILYPPLKRDPCVWVSLFLPNLQKSFEKCVHMSYTSLCITVTVWMKPIKTVALNFIIKGRMNYGIITGMAEDCL